MVANIVVAAYGPGRGWWGVGAMEQHGKLTAKAFIAEAEARGYAVAHVEDGLATADVVEAFQGAGCKLLRDRKISSTPDAGDLAAVPGDFWFHTDGSFQLAPPRWVLV